MSHGRMLFFLAGLPPVVRCLIAPPLAINILLNCHAHRLATYDIPNVFMKKVRETLVHAALCCPHHMEPGLGSFPGPIAPRALATGGPLAEE
jgi:hypothetical protein